MALAAVTLDDKYALQRGRVYLTGTQALVRLPIMQRQRDVTVRTAARRAARAAVNGRRNPAPVQQEDRLAAALRNPAG